MISEKAKEQCILEGSKYDIFEDQSPAEKIFLGLTPTNLVLEILRGLQPEVWIEGQSYLDPTASVGQFLAAILIIKMDLGHKNALATLFGTDIDFNKVIECRQRLINIAGDTPENWKIVTENIVEVDPKTQQQYLEQIKGA